MKFVSGSNNFNEKDLDIMIKELEDGNEIEVGISCIGHTKNNLEQEEYKKHLLEKFGSKLQVQLHEGVCSYHYSYKLEQ